LQRLVPEIIRRLDPGRYQSHVICVERVGRLGSGLGEFAEIHAADYMRFFSMLRPKSLTRQIRQIAPDVVHTHSGVWYMASLAARLAGVHRVVHTDHGRIYPDPWHNRVVDGLAARRTDVVVAVSEALADQLARTVVRDVSRIQVVFNGVDTERHRPRPDNLRIRRELGIPENVPIIGAIGRLDAVKDYEVMLRAFHRLQAEWQDRPAPFLLLAGDGPERASLAALVDELGLQGTARLLGWRDDVEDLHAAFSLFTMSSLSEGTSMSLLEAMSAGLCPVVTDVGGNRAILGERLRHLLAPSGDPVALASAWHSALTNPAGRKADSHAARERVRESFALERTVREYERIYHGQR